MEHHESAEDIAAEFCIHPSLLWQWSAKASRPGGLRTQHRTGRPEEWNEEASEAMADAIRKRRRGKNKQSQGPKKLRGDMARAGAINPKTKKPFDQSTIHRHRKAQGFKPRLRRKRPGLDADLMKMRLKWAEDHKERRWIACRDGGTARVFLDEWWARSHAGRFRIWRCDSSDSEDDYDAMPSHPNKVMSLVGVCRDAPDGKVGLWHMERHVRRANNVYSDKPGEKRLIDGTSRPNPNAVIVHEAGSFRLEKTTMDAAGFMWLMVLHVIPAVRNRICLKTSVTKVELQLDNASPHVKAFPTLRDYLAE